MRLHYAGRIAEDAASCAIIAREVGAIQQLILMALSDNEVVVQQACKILGGLQYPSSSLPMVAQKGLYTRLSHGLCEWKACHVVRGAGIRFLSQRV